MNGVEMGVAKLCRNSYVLSAEPTNNNTEKGLAVTAQIDPTLPQNASGTLMEWHQRLGHLGFDDVKLLVKTGH